MWNFAMIYKKKPRNTILTSKWIITKQYYWGNLLI